MFVYVFTEIRSHQQIAPVCFGQFYGLPQLIQPTFTQFDCRKTDTFLYVSLIF